MPVAERENGVDDKAVETAIERAKRKNARLRLLKERNENYLAEQKEHEHELDEELTKELK